MKSRYKQGAGGGTRGSVNSDIESEMANPAPAVKVAGQPVQFSTKDRTQCMENDRFMITKKVIVDQLPDPKKKSIKAPLNKITTHIEVSAQEVHEAYLKQIEEMRSNRKKQEEAKRQAEIAE